MRGIGRVLAGSGPISVSARGSRSDEVSGGVIGSTHEYGDDFECSFSMRTVFAEGRVEREKGVGNFWWWVVGAARVLLAGWALSRGIG
jgi:hypothetical protein